RVRDVHALDSLPHLGSGEQQHGGLPSAAHGADAIPSRRSLSARGADRRQCVHRFHLRVVLRPRVLNLELGIWNVEYVSRRKTTAENAESAETKTDPLACSATSAVAFRVVKQMLSARSATSAVAFSAHCHRVTTNSTFQIPNS